MHKSLAGGSSGLQLTSSPTLGVEEGCTAPLFRCGTAASPRDGQACAVPPPPLSGAGDGRTGCRHQQSTELDPCASQRLHAMHLHRFARTIRPQLSLPKFLCHVSSPGAMPAWRAAAAAAAAAPPVLHPALRRQSGPLMSSLVPVPQLARLTLAGTVDSPAAQRQTLPAHVRRPTCDCRLRTLRSGCAAVAVSTCRQPWRRPQTDRCRSWHCWRPRPGCRPAPTRPWRSPT
jgi:hypothetical protein